MKKQKLLFMFFQAALLLCWSVALASAGTVSLPATGQTKYYQGLSPYLYAEIACAGTGQDGDKRTGVMWPNPRFTVSGNCVTDNLTGLIWTKNADLPNGTKTWQQALDYVTSLNASAGGGLCGHTDWRLPQVLELESLLNEGYNGKNADWLNTQGIKNAQSGHYWSSTTSTYGPGYAWYVSFYDYAIDGNDKAFSLHVWPVCGGQLSAAPSEVWKTGQTKCYQGVSPYAEIACAGTGQDGDKRTGVAWPIRGLQITVMEQ